jgi:hypothetical protein
VIRRNTESSVVSAASTRTSSSTSVVSIRHAASFVSRGALSRTSGSRSRQRSGDIPARWPTRVSQCHHQWVTRARACALTAVGAVLCVFSAVALPAGAGNVLSLPAVRMMETPPSVLRLCRRSPRLSPFCPHRLPYVEHLRSEPPYLSSLCRVGHGGCAGLTWDDLELEHSGSGDRPPRWAHASVGAGRIIGSRAVAFSWPTTTHRVVVHDGLFASRRPRALFLGHVRWGARSGELVLAPSFPSGGMMSDHLIFYSGGNATGRMVTLHGWEPFTQVVATLRAIVLSTGRA